VVNVNKQLSRLSGIKNPKACDQCTLIQTTNPASSQAERLFSQLSPRWPLIH